MKKIIFICMMTLTCLSCSKDMDSYVGGVDERGNTTHPTEFKIDGVYHLDVAYDNGCDTILAFIGDKDMVIYRSYQGGASDDYVTVQYSLSENKIQFGTDIVDALETLYIQEIHSCQRMVECFKGKDEYADMLEFFTNRLNKVANERKAFMTSVGTTVTRWDIELVGDVYKTDDGIKIVIHGRNGLSKEYLFVN